MPCYNPLKAYFSKEINPSGKRSITFNIKQAYDDKVVTLPCGQCIGCRLERSRQWAVRCVHEASLYEDNCFLTLTFDNDHLPKDGSLDVKVFQDFMKRFRKKFGKGIRFFHCGEYGELNQRPHYHAIIFNFDFKDKKLFKSVRGNNLFVSDDLSSLWPFGFSTIGDVTFESAAYVARYITKKVTGDRADEHYGFIDYETGEWKQRKPEYTTMSRRPGIGKPWLDKFMTDVYPSDFIIMNGKKIKPPRFYDNKHKLTFPFDHDEVLQKRNEKGQEQWANNTPERLEVRRICHETKVSNLKRGYESGQE